MRNWIVPLALAAFSFVGVMGDARAEEEFDAVPGKGQVTINAKGHWHVNKDFPWKVVAGDQTFDKTKFSLSDSSASISGIPAGKVKVTGGVCSGQECKRIVKEVTVQ